MMDCRLLRPAGAQRKYLSTSKFTAVSPKMCPRCYFKEVHVIPSLEVKISNNPPSLARYFKVHDTLLDGQALLK